MSYNIPLFKLNFDEREEKAALETIQSKWISTGPRCEEFEHLFGEMFHVKHALSLSNCTDALHLAYKVIGIQDGDEIICPSLTFAASVNTIKYAGATPIFCDIQSLEHPNIDPEKIEALITPKTKAIVVVDLAGFPCHMDRIMEIAKKHHLKVVEDACHGPLSEYQGKKLGTIGDIGCFSFFSNKNISTGEGGMLITNNKDYYNKAKLLRSHGMTTMSYQRAKGHATSYDIVEVGYNYRMDDIRAAIGIVQLKKLQTDLELRVQVRAQFVEQLKGCNKIIIPFMDNKEFVSNYIMPIVLKDSTKDNRDHIRDLLHAKGIQTSVHYPAIHKFSVYNTGDISLPLTEYYADNTITLPMFGTLSKEEVNYICSTLISLL